MTLTKVAPIMKRELRSYFDSPLAYIILTVFLLATGWFFFSTFFLRDQADLRDLFTTIPWILLFFVPAITMRLLAEEKKTGSIELLSTMPVTDLEIILGKWLAALVLTVVAIFLTLPHLFTVMALAKGPSIDWGPVIGGYFGLILLSGSYLAVGTLCSSFTKNQIAAFIISLAILFIAVMFNRMVFLVPDFIAGFLQYLSPDYHFDNIARGVIDTRDVLYYVTLMIVALFLATRTLAARKWR